MLSKTSIAQTSSVTNSCAETSHVLNVVKDINCTDIIIMIDTLTKRVLTNQTSQTKATESSPITTSSFAPFLLPTSYHCRLLTFPVCVIIIGEDSFVITSRQHRIDWFLQCVFQGLVHGFNLESIMLFSSWKEDSLYPVSRCRATIELSPHLNDVRVRLVDMSVPSQTPWPIVKDVFMTELVIRDVSNWLLLDPLLCVV